MSLLLQLRYERDQSDVADDDAITTHHFGLLAAIATEAQLTAAETAVAQAASFWTPLWQLGTGLYEVRMYDVTGPGPSGPPRRVTDFSAAGSGAGLDDMLPPQCAFSVTERTAIRKRWGRFYLPLLMVSAVSETGRWTADVVDRVLDGTIAFYADMNTAGLPATVMQADGLAANLVTSARADDVTDVIRRRRYRDFVIRETRAV